MTTTSNLLDQGAMIANISVSEHTVEDAKIVLNEKVNNWKETKVVSFQFKNREVTASVEELFFFDIDQSIELAKKQSQTPMITQLLDYQLNDVIFQLAGEDILFKLNREQLEQDLLMYASYLSPENKQINIHDYIYDHLKEEVTISKSELDVLEHGSYFYLNQIVESLNGYNIEPNETVSLLSIFKRAFIKFTK
ncbi:MAG: hypothetical protein LRY71_14905 [Bacillaceae bacterium]|nr:hypothetical protein [Bacillaceae bacterium]